MDDLTTGLQDQLAASPPTSAPPEVPFDGEDWEMVSVDDVAGLHALSRPTRSTSSRFRAEISFSFRHGECPTATPKQSGPPLGEEGKFDWQTQSILFRLPDTIREQIYKEVLVLETPRVRLKRTQPWGGHPVSVLALLATCRRVASEAEYLFYKFNHFVLTGSELKAWSLRGLSAERRDALTRVTISVTSAAGALAMLTQLQLAPNIEYLDIERRIPIRYTNIREWAMLAKQLIVEIRKFKRLQKIRIVYSEGNWPSQEELQGAPRLQSIDSMLTEDVGDGGSKLET